MRIFLRIYGKKKILVKDVKICNWFERFMGLMFSRREKARALLFDFKKPGGISIHSFFVFFPFVAFWLDEKNRIIGHELVKPFTLPTSPKKRFNKILEIPLNRKYSPLIECLD